MSRFDQYRLSGRLRVQGRHRVKFWTPKIVKQIRRMKKQRTNNVVYLFIERQKGKDV